MIHLTNLTTAANQTEQKIKQRALQLYQEHFVSQATDLHSLAESQYNVLIQIAQMDENTRARLLIGYREQTTNNSLSGLLDKLKNDLSATATNIKQELITMTPEKLQADAQKLYAAKLKECHSQLDQYLGKAEIKKHASLTTEVYIFMNAVCAKLKRGLVKLSGGDPNAVASRARTTATHDCLQEIKSELPSLSC